MGTQRFIRQKNTIRNRLLCTFTNDFSAQMCLADESPFGKPHETSCCTECFRSAASAGCAACHFAVQAVQDMKQTLHMTTRENEAQTKKSVPFTVFTKCPERSPPHTPQRYTECCQGGGWQDMRSCRPLTDTDHFLAASASVYFPI